MKKVKIAFVGAGFIGQLCHIKNYFINKKCEIVALAEEKKKLCELVSKKYFIKNTFNSHLDLLKSDLDYDAVVIVVNKKYNASIAYDFINKNKNVFIEKPIALNSVDAKKLIKLSIKKKILFKVGYNKIYDDGINQAKKIFDKLIVSKKLGNIIYIKIHRFSGTGYQNHSGNIQTNEKNKNKIKLRNFNSRPNKIKLNSQYNQYLNYLNINCHLVNLLKFFLEKNPKNVDYVNFSAAELVILNYIKYKATIETKHFKDHFWDEEILFYFEGGFLQIKTPPQQLENVSAKVILSSRYKKKSVEIYGQKSTWSFKNQADQFVDDLRNKRKRKLNLSKDSLDDIILIEKIWNKWITQK